MAWSTALPGGVHNLKCKELYMDAQEDMHMNDYNKITALYSRLSVGDEDRDGGESNSIQNQKIFLENYARGQRLTNIRHYIDDDESGRFFDRSAYSRMMDDVENGKIGVCIMKDLTRWGRDYLQVGNAMEIFRRNNVRFIAVNNGIDSEKPDTLEFAPFINIMSEWYAKDISKKVKTGIKTKGMNGKPIATEAPYGYVKDPDNKDFWIIDEEAAEVVRLIFRLFIGGKNRNQIAVYLKNEQIPTPTFYMKDRGRGTCKNKALNEDNRYKWNKATLTHSRLLNVLQHTLWFLPNVASCYAMANLLADRKNTFYHDYRINVCAGTEAGIGAAALEPVQRSMGDPLATKTITLSCGKLTTGVTVKPWTGIFMLRNLSSPETYFQAAFRVQSPWEVTTDKGQKEIIKKECYVFDFALNRALRQISDYSCRLNIHEGNPEKKVAEFINFLPVIAYDGSSMRQINAGDILDIAMAGTSATLLAKRWESVLLVNVDNETLSRLIANKDAMDALMKIEGFRSLNSDIETIIAKSEKVKKAKKEGTKDLTPKQKKELSDEEKEYKSKRKQIQEKLIKFATRIPVFMYLTDYRERCLKDVITQLEPGLFKKVTGLSVKDFELLVSLGVFNDSLMNDAVYKFKRYEDASLSYTGINRHEGEDRGGWDTVLSDADYNKMFTLQQASMEAPAPAPDDLPAKPIISYGGFTPKTNTAQNTQASGSKIHKPSSSYTPRPVSGTPGSFTPRPAGSSVGIGVANSSFGLNSQPAAQPKPPVKVDVSKIKVGVKVKHKAFGVGTVAAIQPDMVTVRFGNVEKKFLLPAAIVQGYLTVVEN